MATDTETEAIETGAPPAPEMFGRRMILTAEPEITSENVVRVLNEALTIHALNRAQIDYLWRYYRGDQPILGRVKTVRPEICNRIVVNRANEIVSFKVGYQCGEPIQYIGLTEEATEAVNRLNRMMFLLDKAMLDRQTVEWQMVCGTAYRLVRPVRDKGDISFSVHVLDPRLAFTVYSADVDQRPLMGVYITCVDPDRKMPRYCIYTDKFYVEIENGGIVQGSYKTHVLGMVPIIEYPVGQARLGSFEIVLPLLDSLNNVESNRVDGIEQFVQSFIKFINCDIDREKFLELKDLGAIKVSSPEGKTADVEIVTSELNQQQTQTTVDDLYGAVLSICGVPNRNGGSSTSDTGQAVILRDGWSLAESRAKDHEECFKPAERRMLKLVLRILRDRTEGFDLKLEDVDIKFTRRNYEAIQSKSQVLISMLGQDKIHPKLAFIHSGMFSDPEAAYLMSSKYAEEQERKLREQQAQQPAPANPATPPDGDGPEPSTQADGDTQPAQA